jgi:hypothetical protein
MERNSRRSFLEGAAAAVIVTPRCERRPHDVSWCAPYIFPADEAAFIGPAVLHRIPADETGPGRSKPRSLSIATDN